MFKILLQLKVKGLFALVAVHPFIYSQNEFSLPLGTKICDIPGDHFLGYRIAEDNFVSEFDGNGELVWSGSTVFFGGSDGLYLMPPVGYSGTDQYLIIMTRDITSILFSDDSSQYQFMIVDLSEQDIVTQATDTFYSHSIIPIVYNDTAVFLFQKYVAGSGPDLTEVLTIGTDLNISAYTASDSIESYYYAWDKYFLSGSGIYRIQNLEPFAIQSDYYNLPFSSSGMVYLGMPWGDVGEPDNNDVFFMDTVGVDSLLIIYESSYSGSLTREWTFLLTDYQLNILNSEYLVAPGSREMRTATATDSEFYLLLKHMDESSTMPETIQVFDFNFNMVCQFSTFFPASEYNGLSTVNNKAYFKRKTGSSDHYYQIDGCDFTSHVPNYDAMNSSFRIFPNPAAEVFEIMPKEGATLKSLHIEIKNLFGETVLRKTLEEDNTISISNYSSGTYIVFITGEGSEVFTSKLIVR